uniref:(California timema) hypothetical protein n=1 Tax=Timema californicum TaxID=61474 RepID=A0A7R9IW97_TIMCA|nr:unnamed protein product [Timema californicum]
MRSTKCNNNYVSFCHRKLPMDVQDTKNSVGLAGCIEEVSHNAIAVYWNPLESSAKINIAVQCLSTDFSSQKGVKVIGLGASGPRAVFTVTPALRAPFVRSAGHCAKSQANSRSSLFWALAVKHAWLNACLRDRQSKTLPCLADLKIADFHQETETPRSKPTRHTMKNLTICPFLCRVGKKYVDNSLSADNFMGESRLGDFKGTLDFLVPPSRTL